MTGRRRRSTHDTVMITLPRLGTRLAIAGARLPHPSIAWRVMADHAFVMTHCGERVSDLVTVDCDACIVWVRSVTGRREPWAG
jgi:hypothetical protein